MKPQTVDEYIEVAPEIAKGYLNELRAILKNIEPHSKEALKWGKPVFELDTILYAYSAHKFHISFIPTGPTLKPFEDELIGFKVSKDSVQFSFGKPLPVDLIKRIAEYRVRDVKENGAKWKY